MILRFAALMSFVVLTFGSAAALSLSDAVRLAVDVSPEVLEAQANARAVRAQMDQARALYFPTLDVEAFVGPQYVDRPNGLSAANNARWRTSREVSATASFTLFDGFFRANEMFRQATRLESAGFRALEAAEIVALDTVEAYVDVLRHRRVLRAADNNISQHQFILGQAQTQFDGGAATQGEVDIAAQRLAASRAIRAEVARALGNVEARFIRLVGQAPGHLHPVAPPNGTPRSVEQAIEAARSRHPALDAAMLDVSALEASAEQQLASALPEVVIQGRGTYGFDVGGTPGENLDASVRLLLRWRIFDGGLRAAEHREQVERVGEARLRLDRSRRDIDEDVRRAWVGVTTNDDRLHALRDQLQQAEQVLVSYYEEYDAGLRTLLDLLDAQNARFNAEFEVASSEAIAIFARYQLIGSSGALLDHFGLRHLVPEPDVRDDDLRLYRGASSPLEPLRR